ncbi:MAG: endonuclease [Bacteroidales bacterium]|nr:endonuclease [Bacteroidales bacterium]
MKTIILFLLAFLMVVTAVCRAQQARIVFYNVENLFDTENDTLTNDDEFLPDGPKRWTHERYYRKVVRVYQVMAALGRGELPAVIGVCEIENRKVLNSLVYETPFHQFGYRIIHRDSPDRRGIDVAVLYQPDLFTPDSAEWLEVPLGGGETTREILHVRGRLWDDNPIHIYVNHWPSRYGGAGSSQPKRVAAAATLAASVKRIYADEEKPNIVIMGDFNDGPEDESLQIISRIRLQAEISCPWPIVNLSTGYSIAGEGTLKHGGSWNVFDQVLVSCAMIKGENGLIIMSERAEIFKAGFLLEEDMIYTGTKPYRTYIGPAYHGGFSDHLPVSVTVGRLTGGGHRH